MSAILAAALLCLSPAAAPTAAEQYLSEQWVAVHFEGAAPPAPAPENYINAVRNHGPVQADARGGRPLNLAGTQYERGLYCHASSRLEISLAQPAQRFEAVVGVDSNDQTSGGRGSVIFRVRVGDAVAWQSEVLREGATPVPVRVELGGVKAFALEVSDSGDGISCDQADWAEARVILDGGAEMPLGDFPIRDMNKADAFLQPGPLFSFVHGGRPSGEFLDKWAVQRESRERDAARREHVITYTDPETGLEARIAGIEYLDCPVVEWTLYFANRGSADSPILSDIRAVDTCIGGGDFTLHTIRGDNCTPDSYAPFEVPLAAGTDWAIANTGGRPTQEAFPCFNAAGPDSGVICALAWPGQWAVRFTNDADKGLRFLAGQELTHFVLHPGEEVRAPLTVLLFYRGDWLRGQNLWRAWMLAHNTPQPGGKPVAPQASLCTGNFYPGLMTEATQEIKFLQRHLDENIPFDCWWQDAGWYPCDGVGWPKTGTWEPDPGRFPNGLRAISDFMHANGKKTMVWFEPERVHAGTWITETHPEWVHGGADGGLLRLDLPECRAWLTDHIDRLLTEQGIDFYRQDFNMDPLPFWRAADTEDRQGITEIRHVEGYLAWWDALRKRHPDMLIDSCASGGRRNDLETLRRAVPLLRSDYYNSGWGQQCLTYGLALWIPYQGTGVIYEKDDYWVRSSFVSEISFGPDTAGVDQFDFARFRARLGEWRQMAPSTLGEFYPLTPYSQAQDIWMAWQWNRPGGAGGAVQAFRRESSPYMKARFPLRALDPDAEYEIRDADGAAPIRRPGRDLIENGLDITLENRPAAAILFYERLGGG